MVTGIDCSKDYFDIAVLRQGKVTFSGRFDNTESGFEDALVKLQGSHVSMEATGPYYFRLACFLQKSGVLVSVLNPLVVRRFSQMCMSRAKTDKKDAVLIAQYTAMTSPGEWQCPSAQVQRIGNLETYLEGLKQRMQMLGNQLHAFGASGTLDKEFTEEIESELSVYQDRIREKTLEIDRLITENYSDLSKNIRSIPGIGPRSAALMIIQTDGFSTFDNYRQLISYFGLAPRTYESGSSVRGKNSICKMGMGKIRKVLYMAGTAAVRCNKTCKELYERLRTKGKPHKVALIAAVNKLLKQVFAIAKSGEKYRVPFS